jgi:hypothetical protein
MLKEHTYSRSGGTQLLTFPVMDLAYADRQGPVGIGSTRAKGSMMPGDQVHIFGRRFASAALKPLQDVREGSIAIA